MLEDNLPLPEKVEGGFIVRDDEGRPTGWFLYLLAHGHQKVSYNTFLGVLLDNAQDLIKQPDPAHDDLLRRFKLTMTHAMSYGLTSIHDAGLNPQSMDFFKKFACLALANELIFNPS